MRLRRLPHILAVAIIGAIALTSTIRAQEPWPDDIPTTTDETVVDITPGPVDGLEVEPTDEPTTDVGAPEPTAEPTESAQQPFNSTEPFQPAGIYWVSNCGLTAINVYLRDGAGNYVNGVRVRVETRDGSWGAYSFPTGNPGYGPGETDITLAQDQIAGVWLLWVVDASNQRISPIVPVETDRNDCRPEGFGHQVAHVQFVDRRVPEPPTAARYDWLAGGILWEPNCSVTQLKLFARGATGQPLNKVRFMVQSGNWSTISNPTGVDTTRPGWTDVALRTEAFKNTWQVFVINDQAQRVSDILRVETNDVDCGPDGHGHQVATIVWSKRS